MGTSQPDYFTSGTLIDLQNTSSENLLQVTINNSAAELRITLASESQVVISNTAIQWGQWVQLAISYDQTTPTATIFINGNETQDITLSDTIPSFANSRVILGNNATKNAVLEGAIAQLLLWDKALSESELLEKTMNTSIENDIDLKGLWKAENAEVPLLLTTKRRKCQPRDHRRYSSLSSKRHKWNRYFSSGGAYFTRPKNANSLNFLNPSSAFHNDPYSNQMTIICPKLAPFNNRGYQDHFTHIVQSEAPAHVYVNILWVIYPSDLSQFESHYREWLEAQKVYLDFENTTNIDRYKIAHQNFIGTFNALTTKYSVTNQELCKWILLLKNNDCR